MLLATSPSASQSFRRSENLRTRKRYRQKQSFVCAYVCMYVCMNVENVLSLAITKVRYEGKWWTRGKMAKIAQTWKLGPFFRFIPSVRRVASSKPPGHVVAFAYNKNVGNWPKMVHTGLKMAKIGRNLVMFDDQF